MPKVAAEKAVEAVTRLPNLIRIVDPGVPDKVIRIIPMESKTLWMDRGPDIEEWERIKREVFLKAPPDQKLPVPVPVGTLREWTLLPEDVPVITLEDKKK